MRWSFGPEFWALAALSAAAALVYGVFFLARPPSLWRAIVKAIAAGALGAACATAGAFALTFALAWAALGDVLFAFERKWLAPFAVIAFFFTQIGYLVALLPLWIFAGDLSPLWPRYAAIALILLVTVGFLIWIAPKLRLATLLAAPYAIPLAGVACAAMWQDWRGWPVIPGAMLWLASHAFSAAAYVRAAAPPAPLRWWTYAAAHALMVTGAALASPYMN